jgi:hypothetical protein
MLILPVAFSHCCSKIYFYNIFSLVLKLFLMICFLLTEILREQIVVFSVSGGHITTELYIKMYVFYFKHGSELHFNGF